MLSGVCTIGALVLLLLFRKHPRKTACCVLAGVGVGCAVLSWGMFASFTVVSAGITLLQAAALALLVANKKAAS